MATSTANRTNYRPAAANKSIFSRILFGVFLFLILAAVAAVILLIFGRCSGEEFSAADFTRRSFYYFRVPLVKFQVTPIMRSDEKSVLINHLHKKRLIPKGGQKNWELAQLQVASGHPYEADELILVRYLQQRNSAYDLRWLKWSQNNPRLARAFWPVAWRVANEDLYVLIPELFELARYTPDPVDLDAKMRKLIVQDGARIAAGEYQLANYQRAARIAAFVLAVAEGEQIDANQSNDSLAESVGTALDIQSQTVNRGVEPVASENLAAFDPSAPEPEDLADDRDETEPVEPDDDEDSDTDRESAKSDSTYSTNADSANSDSSDSSGASSDESGSQ